MKFIVGKKIEMTQRFAEDGKVTPVTVVNAGPCVITQVKTADKDGYVAVQIGFDEKKKLNKAQAGHLKGLDNLRHLREFRVDEAGELKRGDVITVDTFSAGDTVKIVGTSKGKGFQGVVRRHGFKGGKGSHGDKDQLRMPGSIGATDAARVFKGRRMAGQMGNARTTVTNLEITDIDTENNLLFIKGAIPGARNGLVTILAEGELKTGVAAPTKEAVEEKPKAEAPVETKEEKVDEKPETTKKEDPSTSSGSNEK